MNKDLLLNNLMLLVNSVEVLQYSHNNCLKIGIKDNYSMQELGEFEALASRFSRSVDILTQKVLKTLFMVMQEEAKFFIDRCNLSEKLGLVDNADDLYNMRALRNEISHEYKTAYIQAIFKPLLSETQVLLETIEKVKKNIKAL